MKISNLLTLNIKTNFYLTPSRFTIIYLYSVLSKAHVSIHVPYHLAFEIGHHSVETLKGETAVTYYNTIEISTLCTQVSRGIHIAISIDYSRNLIPVKPWAGFPVYALKIILYIKKHPKPVIFLMLVYI